MSDVDRARQKTTSPPVGRRKRIATIVAGLALGLAGGMPAAHAAIDAPMYYLHSFGSQGKPIATLTWGLLGLSVAVVLIISVAVVVGVLLRRTRAVPLTAGRLPVERAGSGMPWIYIGLGLTVVALAGFVAWTMATMAAIASPAQAPKITIAIRGHQWWWELEYRTGDPSRQFTTANEIHVPVGEPVRLEFTTADVIHTFWVPAIAGKTDLIPGQTNVAWIEADAPGVYRGQCNEYCGQQHAHMRLTLFADPPDKFQAWWDAQVQAAHPPEAVARGKAEFARQCSACHTVRGTLAGGQVGPDLTHLMSRSTIAAGMLPNTIGNLSGWVANPQVIKPGSKMPNLDLSGPELDAVRSYVLTLK
ncbi:MAG TPA: cytochrome c oxidase subunit II [Alphaproteobacteria bacterium]|nr:cytochrome c oxidase subunit II [Alphaproteobacteria bacterium]